MKAQFILWLNRFSKYTKFSETPIITKVKETLSFHINSIYKGSGIFIF